MTTKTAVIRAALRAAGLSRGRVEVGYRADRRDDPRRMHRAEPTCNELHWHNGDLPHGDLYDVCALEGSDLKGPAILDLYVYELERGGSGGDLITNVCAVISADGTLLDCFDSVSGYTRLGWWLEGTACECARCGN